MKNLKLSLHLDKIGITASAICAIHCAFLPVLVTMLPLAGIGFMAKSWIESLMILLSVLIAGVSLGSSYKLHQKHLPLILLLIGIVLIAIAHLFLPEKPEHFVTPVGGLTVAAAHYFNWDFSGKCSAKHSHTTAARQSK